jgi:DNA-binding MarR family transcriptional regulator
MHLYRRTRLHGKGGPFGDPTRGQGRILAMLRIQDGISTKDLSYLLGIRVASLNELIAKLERSGHIVREASPDDGRVMLIKLTDAGRAASDTQTAPGDALSALTAEEQANLESYLDKLLEALEAQSAEDNALREQWADEVRERMGDERFAAWMGAVGDEIGDPRLARAVERLRAAEKLRKHGRRRAEKARRYQAMFEALADDESPLGPPPFPPPPPGCEPDGYGPGYDREDFGPDRGRPGPRGPRHGGPGRRERAGAQPPFGLDDEA